MKNDIILSTKTTSILFFAIFSKFCSVQYILIN
jgi:hypothetical protein